MPDSREKNQDPSGILPRPELNPLVNPVLENHLGRWAEVYFTSPPEQREQAVEELLHELQRTTQSGPAAVRAESVPHAEVTCPACRFPNISEQRFCGNCGALLENNAALPPAREPVSVVAPLRAEPGADNPPKDAGVDDLQWLRQKAFSQWDEAETAAAPGRRLLVAAFVFIVAAGALASYYWLRNPDRQSTPTQPTAIATPATEPASPTQQIAPEPVPAAAPSPQPKSSTPAAPSRVAPEAGSQDLLLAEQDLHSARGGRDSGQAARLLWRAVGKQNVQAALLLSDLYARGDGVPQSCDQARLLLVAAAKKGSSAAAEHLRSLESGGCR